MNLLQNKKIAIIGAGPRGLTLATLLQKKGADVKVYERDFNRDVRVQGTTLDLHFESGLKAIEAAGLMDTFKANYRNDNDPTRIIDEHAKIFFDDHNEESTGDFWDECFAPEIDLGSLRKILLNSLQPDTVVWNSHIVSLESIDSTWKIIFENGNTVIADIVIWADGVNSKIRPFVTSTTLLETKHDMPRGLNVISWNYDMQFELAYQSFTNESDLYAAQDNLGVFLKFKDNWRVTEKFGIYKLNGSSIAYTSNNAKLVQVYSKAPKGKLSIETLQEIFKSYCFLKDKPKEFDLGLSFAWEDENTNFGRKDIVTVTKEKTINTEILVIIGYSIPFFNRKIDREVIKNMTKLEKVYFQSPDADALIERFTSIRNDLDPSMLIPIKNCDQFHVPNEL